MNIPGSIVRSVCLQGILFVLFTAAVACSRAPYHPELLDYLKAEREVRKRVKLEVQLADSLSALQNTFGIDPEVEFAKLRDRPELWIDLIEELRRAQ